MHNTCCGGEAKGQRRDVGFSTIRNTPTPREVTSAALRDNTLTDPPSIRQRPRNPSHLYSTAQPAPTGGEPNVASIGSGTCMCSPEP